jgi:hypothetical protein
MEIIGAELNCMDLGAYMPFHADCHFIGHKGVSRPNQSRRPRSASAIVEATARQRASGKTKKICLLQIVGEARQR